MEVGGFRRRRVASRHGRGLGGQIAAGMADGHVIALDGSGPEIWRAHLGAAVSMARAIDDVPLDAHDRS